MGSHWTVHFDGLAEPINPGIGAWGWVVTRDGKQVAFGADFGSDRPYTNNEAEYQGLLAGLHAMIGWVHKICIDDTVSVFGDSQLVIYQMSGKYSCRSDRLIPMYKEARGLEREAPCDIVWQWVPREENQKADELSLGGLRMFGDRYPRVPEKYKNLVATTEQRSILGKLGFECPIYLGRRAADKTIEALRVLAEKDPA